MVSLSVLSVDSPLESYPVKEVNEFWQSNGISQGFARKSLGRVIESFKAAEDKFPQNLQENRFIKA